MKIIKLKYNPDKYINIIYDDVTAFVLFNGIRSKRIYKLLLPSLRWCSKCIL